MLDAVKQALFDVLQWILGVALAILTPVLDALLAMANSIGISTSALHTVRSYGIWVDRWFPLHELFAFLAAWISFVFTKWLAKLLLALLQMI